MSGAVKSNVFGSSGTVAAAAGGLKWESVVTASTVTVESNRGYFVNTTSNACTVTLPSSPDVGDQVILLDYARTWDTNAITIDSNGNNFQGQADTYTVDYDTEGQGINIVYSGSTNGWIPNSDIANALTPVAPPTQRAIFAFGANSSGKVSMSNLVNSSGVVATDVTGVGTARSTPGAASYGGDKAIFGFGDDGDSSAVTNLVNNSGVVGSDVAGVGTARYYIGAAGYGGDKAIFAYGNINVSNLVSNVGVVAADVTGVGTSRRAHNTGVTYGTDKAIFAYGYSSSAINLSNLVSNLGVIGSDVSGVGTARYYPAAASYGTDKAIYGYGEAASKLSMTNKVSNEGVVASDVSGVGTARSYLGGAGYGGDKGIFAFGDTGGSGWQNVKNLINNSGVVAADATGVGTARRTVAAGYSFTA